jgi:hypothetical protein
VALRVVGAVVDAKHERHIGVVGHGRDDDGAGTRLEVRLCLVALFETSGHLNDHVDTEILPGEILGFRDRGGSQPVPADADRLRAGDDLCGEPAEKRVELEQVRHRLRVAEVVDRDDLVVGATLEVSA